jgi:hypothetical protein
MRFTMFVKASKDVDWAAREQCMRDERSHRAGKV